MKKDLHAKLYCTQSGTSPPHRAVLHAKQGKATTPSGRAKQYKPRAALMQPRINSLSAPHHGIVQAGAVGLAAAPPAAIWAARKHLGYEQLDAAGVEEAHPVGAQGRRRY